jgi:hypothetical protein
VFGAGEYLFFDEFRLKQSEVTSGENAFMIGLACWPRRRVPKYPLCAVKQLSCGCSRLGFATVTREERWTTEESRLKLGSNADRIHYLLHTNFLPQVIHKTVRAHRGKVLIFIYFLLSTRSSILSGSTIFLETLPDQHKFRVTQHSANPR